MQTKLTEDRFREVCFHALASALDVYATERFPEPSSEELSEALNALNCTFSNELVEFKQPETSFSKAIEDLLELGIRVEGFQGPPAEKDGMLVVLGEGTYLVGGRKWQGLLPAPEMQQ